MRMSKYARAHAPVPDAQEDQGTIPPPPPSDDDLPPREILEELADLDRRGLLTEEVIKSVVESARKHGKKYGFRL
jgi:hypothetical protein